MKNTITALLCLAIMTKIFSQTNYYDYPVYKGKDLGLTYSKQSSAFKIWSPVASDAKLFLYKEGDGGDAFKTVPLSKDSNGIWLAKLPGDWKGVYYTFSISINNEWSNEVPDPYAKAVGVNGKRAMVVDLKETNPAGWDKDKSPAFSKTNQPTDAVIYELQIRDASTNAKSGIEHKGKYLGLVELNTKSGDGELTGLSHLKELGVTHIHLLPFFDHNSIDETKLDMPQYNWGYDPLNYNAPEGSFSTDPYNGATRIKELKQMIAAIHKNGLRIVMDVVYNHVSNAATSNFEQLVPGYYFRHKKDGSFSNASACGNETASELPMMRKFILESVIYWAKEYHIDGFRFDLMGIHDIATMNEISTALHKIKRDILLYGEGWTAGESPLPDTAKALKQNAYKLNGIAVFSDDIRDGIKGSVFEIKDRGFASNKPGMEESVKFGITASTNHPQVDLNKVNYSKKAYAAGPWNVITYCECHDNNALWDKLKLSCPEASETDLVNMHQLALTIVLTSQGIPFLHAGTEFLRTKKGVENSFKSPDSINAIDWALKTKNAATFEKIKQLIAIRKAHPAFRMMSSDAIKKNIRFDKKAPAGTISYTIDAAAAGDSWKKIVVLLNGTDQQQTFNLPFGKWNKAFTSGDTDLTPAKTIALNKYSAVILFQ